MRETAAIAFGAERCAQAPKHDEQPDAHAADQQIHPEAAKLQIFPSLRSKPPPRLAEQAFISEILTREAADNDCHQGSEENIDEVFLPFRLAAADKRGNENTHAEPRRSDPKDRQLQMPRSGNLEGQPVGEGDSIKARSIGVVVRPSRCRPTSTTAPSTSTGPPIAMIKVQNHGESEQQQRDACA